MHFGVHKGHFDATFSMFEEKAVLQIRALRMGLCKLREQIAPLKSSWASLLAGLVRNLVGNPITLMPSLTSVYCDCRRHTSILYGTTAPLFVASSSIMRVSWQKASPVINILDGITSTTNFPSIREGPGQVGNPSYI